ncbi:MAG: NAD-dependent epimerase/dehydratase family protein [Myxococcota bacterium]|nr:NAD-dependent epimerase/dehydratase family protein [Myxococcota bacterium]
MTKPYFKREPSGAPLGWGSEPTNSFHPKDSNVLVTGGSGFIGTWLVRALVRRGAHVTILDDQSTANSLTPDPIPNTRLITESVLDLEVLKRQNIDCDFVFHLAGVVGMRLAHRDAAHAHRVSAEGTRNVLAISGDVPIVLFSSSSVYGQGKALNEGEEVKMSEEQPIDVEEIRAYDGGPIGYANGKVEIERLAHQVSKRGRKCLVVRPFNVIGPGQSARYGMVVPRFIAAARAGAPLRIYDDGFQTRSFGDVGHFIEHLLSLTSQPTAFSHGNNVFNLGNSESTTIAALAKAVKEATGSESPLNYVPYEKDFPGRRDIRHRSPCVDRAESLIGTLQWSNIDEIIHAILRHQTGPQKSHTMSLHEGPLTSRKTHSAAG